MQVPVAFHRLLRDVADEQPVLLVLEDLHWTDATTRDLLAHLKSLADDRDGGGGDGSDLQAIVGRSGGNPFYAEELLSAGESDGLPPSLADVLW